MVSRRQLLKGVLGGAALAAGVGALADDRVTIRIKQDAASPRTLKWDATGFSTEWRCYPNAYIDWYGGWVRHLRVVNLSQQIKTFQISPDLLYLPPRSYALVELGGVTRMRYDNDTNSSMLIQNWREPR